MVYQTLIPDEYRGLDRTVCLNCGDVASRAGLDQRLREANPDFQLFTISTQNDHSRLAIQHAVARATGGEVPAEDAYPSSAFEDSVSGQPNQVTCDPDLPGDIYLSAEMPGDEQADVIG